MSPTPASQVAQLDFSGAQLLRQAKTLDQQSLQVWIDRVDSHPQDLEARMMLALHFLHAQETQSSLVEHYRWLIQHEPDHETLYLSVSEIADREIYSQLKADWLEMLLDAALPSQRYANAAAFLRVNGDIKEAEQILLTASDLEPENSVWHYELASLYKYEGEKDSIEKAIFHLQKAVQNPQNKVVLLRDLTDLGNLQLAADATTDARNSAKQLIQLAETEPSDSPVDTEYALLVAYTILGRIALADGKPEEAANYLVLSADSFTASSLIWQPIDLTVLRQLLALNRHDLLEDFFKRVGELKLAPPVKRAVATTIQRYLSA